MIPHQVQKTSEGPVMPKTTEDAYDYIQDEEDDDNQEESQVVFMPDANTD